MRTELFDFILPEDRIALRPVEPRDAARMLVVRPGYRMQGQGFASPPVLEDRIVRALPELLSPGDVLVVNNTRVIPAALEGTRTRNGNVAGVAFNLIKRVDESRWRAFARPAKRLEEGDRVEFQSEGRVCLAGALSATVAAKLDAGEVELAFSLHGAYLDEAIAALGEMPLPPYIALKRPPDEADRQSYQTAFAERDGAVAAPTASLHFTPELIAALEARGVRRETVTLHVGAGTFLPVKAADTDEHVMHSEWGEITPEVAARLNRAKADGGRIIAAGTTALRLLEAATDTFGRVGPFLGETDIFITPGHRFRAVDILLTNFHLPRSTLFMLVSAFSGLDVMHTAYRHAIRNDYRFYSYGDASLLFRQI